MNERTLIALPVYNEAGHVRDVLNQVLSYASDVLVVNDGSSDGTSEVLSEFDHQIQIETHVTNRGYGAALTTAFGYAVKYGYEVLVTIDCDGQHQPQLIGQIAARVNDSACPVDMVSGSRYLQLFEGNSAPPEDRRRVNVSITGCLNDKLGFKITDAFCGFKAYRVSALTDLDLTVPGYAMPLQLWVQAADLGWRVSEFPIPLVYLEEERSFGGALDETAVRLEYYRDVLNAELSRRGMSQRITADCGQRSA